MNILQRIKIKILRETVVLISFTAGPCRCVCSCALMKVLGGIVKECYEKSIKTS